MKSILSTPPLRNVSHNRWVGETYWLEDTTDYWAGWAFCHSNLSLLWKIKKKQIIRLHAFLQKPHEDAIEIWLKKNYWEEVEWSKSQDGKHYSLTNTTSLRLAEAMGKKEEMSLWIEVEIVK